MIKLYSYQEKVLQAIENDPSPSQLISMPTGTGKTITFLAQAKKMKPNVLILVHRNELLNQTFEKALLIGFNKNDISIINSEEKQEIKQLTIAMVQTLIRNLDKYDHNLINSIIVDEAHHSLADSYISVFKHFKIKEENKMILGFTATPLRGDKKMLESIYASHSFKMTLQEATQQGFICPVYGLKIHINKSLKDIDMVSGDYDISKLDKVINCEEINNLIVERVSLIKKLPGIIFCTSVEHTQTISKLLRRKGIRAIGVSYKTPKNVLEKTMKFLKEGRIHYIINAVKLTEGFDFPPIQSVIIARPTRSPVLYKQMIGRGLRKSNNKYDCSVLEFTSNDTKMINWEDIDQNCTFQSYIEKDKKTRDEAIIYYKTKFVSPNVMVRDVRVSPFNFYECKISRLINYKKWWYITFRENGFAIFKLLPDKLNGKVSGDLYTSYAWMCCWSDIYKEFYVWDQGNISSGEAFDVNTNLSSIAINGTKFVSSQAGCSKKNAENWFRNFTDWNHHSRWYPSEEDQITTFQKKFLQYPYPKTNARKCEMDIEERAVKKALELYFIPNKLEKLMKINWNGI